MTPLTALPNIGKVIAGKLHEVGIESVEGLRQIGANQTIVCFRASVDPCACIRELCALEAAIRGIRDTEFPMDVKTDLRTFHSQPPH